jgi:hypothetical protein
MKTLAKFLILITTSLLMSLCLAWACDTLWGWLAATSTGVDPTLAGWFGVNVVLGLIIGTNTINLAPREAGKGEDVFKSALQRQIGLVIGALMTVGVTWVFAQITGWL